MSPFLQFRLWLRSAPIAERAATAVVLAVLVALAAWALVPGGARGGPPLAVAGGGLADSGASPLSGSGSGGAASSRSNLAGVPGGAASPGAGSAPGGSAGPGASGPGSAGSTGGPLTGAGSGSSGASTGSVAGGSSGSGSGSGGAGGGAGTGPSLPGGGTATAPCPRTAKASPIKLGLPILDIAGPAVNSAFNIPSPTEQQGDWQAIVDSLNAAGGVDCHPLAADYQNMNPADNTSGHTDCLQFVQDRVFAVLGYLSANATPGTGGDECVVQNHIPLFHPQAMPADEVSKYFPYLFGMERTDILYRNFALGAKQLGVFGSGFTKLGIVYKDCQSSLNTELVNDLHAAGLSDSQLDRYDLGCPSSYAPPSSLEQAVLKFKSDGVSTVTFDEPGDPDLPSFTRVASSQLFKPHYVVPDDGLLLDTDHNSTGPDPSNFSGAIAITPNQYGALNTSPPPPLSPATATCDKALTSRGLPDTEHSDGGVAGVDCDLAWLFVAGLTHAPSLAQNQLAVGLQKAGSVPFSYPGGPTAFGSFDSTTGGEFWRPVSFDGSCSCWKVTAAAFRPSF